MNLIYSISDAKLRRSFTSGLVEDILVKRPYTKVLSLELLDNSAQLLRGDEIDLARLARECLKNLSSEDLKQIHIENQE